MDAYHVVHIIQFRTQTEIPCSRNGQSFRHYIVAYQIKGRIESILPGRKGYQDIVHIPVECRPIRRKTIFERARITIICRQKDIFRQAFLYFFQSSILRHELVKISRQHTALLITGLHLLHGFGPRFTRKHRPFVERRPVSLGQPCQQIAMVITQEKQSHQLFICLGKLRPIVLFEVRHRKIQFGIIGRHIGHTCHQTIIIFHADGFRRAFLSISDGGNP